MSEISQAPKAVVAAIQSEPVQAPDEANPSTPDLTVSSLQEKITQAPSETRPKKLVTVEAQKSVDLLIVLGQGPIKPLLREEDLDPEMQKTWADFKTDPLHHTEPDFRVVEGAAYLSELESAADQAQIDAKLAQWQQLGRFGLNRWGRENALSAGYALVSGYTDKLLLSGGKTKPDWAKKKLSPKRIENWPSEAQLMADIIRRRFGPMYQELYGKSIDLAMVTEDRSTNTLENFGNSMNSDQGQEILNGKIKTGVLAADFHVPRGEDIACLFAPGADLDKGLSAQDVLVKRVAEAKNREVYKQILGWMSDANNPDLRAREGLEMVFSKALHDPDLLTYWLGYIGIVEDPRVLQATVEQLNSDPLLKSQATDAFKLAGLDYNELAGSDLTQMPQADFKQIAEKLKVLMTKEYRKMPEIPANLR